MDRRVGGGPLRTAVDRGGGLVDPRVGGRPLRGDPCIAVVEAENWWVVDCPTQMTVQSTMTNAKEHNREIC